MLKIGTRVRTWTGTRENPVYIYGTVAGHHETAEETLCKVDWDGGGYDYLGDYELETVGGITRARQ